MTEQKQQQMKSEIASFMAKKDYYQILGVQKSADQAEIKKAYRTLVLRFHPDKNKVQGSKEVFKKVSHAHSILINPEKRQHYDQFGPEEDRPRPNRRNNPNEDEEYDQYNEYFRTNFGGFPVYARRGNFRNFMFNFGGHQQDGDQEQRQGGMSFTFILLILFLIYNIAPFFRSAPSFSSIPSSDHKYLQKTSLLQTDFYVTQNYFEEVKDLEFKKHSQMMIDREYLLDIEKKCEGKKREKKKLEEKAYREYPGVKRQNYLNQAKTVDLSPCRTIQDLNHLHQDYIRDLTYIK